MNSSFKKNTSWKWDEKSKYREKVLIEEFYKKKLIDLDMQSHLVSFASNGKEEFEFRW